MIIFMIFLIIMYFVLKWAKRLFNAYAAERISRDEAERAYRSRTVKALERISSKVAPYEEEEEQRSALDGLIAGNKKLIEKRSFTVKD